MKNIAVFASGKGSNFLAIAQAVKQGKLKAKIALLVCDNPKAPVLQKASRLRIKTLLIERKNFPSTEAFETEIIKRLKENKVGLLVLAGFMRILSPLIVKAFRGRILNIHPALLPAFKGAHAIKDAFDYGVKITGVTVHFVDEKIDHGPIILQEPIVLKDTDTLIGLETRIHKLEHSLYPKAIKLVLQGRLKITRRKVLLHS